LKFLSPSSMTTNPQYYQSSSFPTGPEFPFTYSFQAEFPQLNFAKAHSFSSSPSNNSVQTSSSQCPWASQSTSEVSSGLPGHLNTSFLEDISDSFFDIHNRRVEEQVSSPSLSLSPLEEGKDLFIS